MKEELEMDIKQKTSTNKICPDHDDECKDVPDHLACFLGNLHCIDIGIAKGYCPFIHKEN